MLEFNQKCLSQIEDLKDMCNPDNLEKAVEGTMWDAEARCFVYALGNCPKDTGELAESLYTYPIKDGFVIGDDAGHAAANEFGSITTPIGDVDAPMAAKKVGVRPFIRPAIHKVRDEFVDIFDLNYSEIFVKR